MSHNNKHKIFIMKDSGQTLGVDGKQLNVLKLRHPKTELSASFLLNSASNEILEVQSFEDNQRSWLLGSCIEPDGQIYICTPFDPLFVVLSCIRKRSKYAEQLDQLLVDHDFPDVARLASVVDTSRLLQIAERKGGDDVEAYKYNEDRTLTWLERRTRRLAAVLEAKRLHGTSGKADNFVKVTKADVEKEVYLKFAWGITSEYLPSDLSAALRQRLKLPEEKLKAREPASAQPAAKKARKGEPVAPLEDYSLQSTGKKTVATPQNAKQKALAKSAVGTKSIMSFFSKK